MHHCQLYTSGHFERDSHNDMKRFVILQWAEQEDLFSFTIAHPLSLCQIL